jgi:uncharacterized protein (DUF305 family)
MASTSTDVTDDVEVEELDRDQDRHPSFFRTLRTSWLMLGILIAVIFGASVFLYQTWPKAPGDDSAEAGFLRDMSVHHAQAVQMALIIRDRTEDEQLKSTATDIVLTQQNQIGMMDGWLTLWDLPHSSSDPAMAWMDHPVDGLMPGMATQEQIDSLLTLPVDEAEVLFLQLMIHHHQGGVDMGQGYLDRGDQKDVKAFAENVKFIQTSEIGTMNQMLEARGEKPITDPLPTGH